MTHFLLFLSFADLQVNHLRCLHEFVEAQAAYYKQCHFHMQELQQELARYQYESNVKGVCQLLLTDGFMLQS